MTVLFFKALPYFIVFGSALVVTLVLTPLVREVARRLGMVDKPDARRINKTPIPRGGGIAIVIGMFVTYGVFHAITGRPFVQGVSDVVSYKMAVLAVAMSLLGLADDRFSLRPRWKLFGQLAIAALVWFWAGLGFRILWPSLPAWVDCLLTVFWIVGAVNAFNLIDGLDGLAGGISLIAVVGIGGSLFFTGNPQANLIYFALAGAILGFLRYNWNPASVFLGDAGSMFLGFQVATLPLASQMPNSFLVSVGVPLLAMGVPIFDTTLAIVRRSLRRFLGAAGGSGEVMTADSDHLHHRLLRSAGFNQRRAALVLYAVAFGLVATGVVAMYLESRAAGVWLAAFSLAVIVMFKDAYIELFEAARVANVLAHPQTQKVRRRLARLTMPGYVVVDILLLIAVFFICCRIERIAIDLRVMRTFLLVRVAATFGFLVLFRAYRTVWSRAVLSNFARIFAACLLGAVLGSVVVYYWPTMVHVRVRTMTVSYALMSFVAIAGVRILRRAVRDLFYAIDCSRLRERRDVSRILVYGCGLRYQSFRRELVRTTSANDRMIVGILDDDVYIKGRYIGGMKILGTIQDAPSVIDAVNADHVVIACDITDEWLKVVLEILKPTGVKVSKFSLSETLIEGDSN